MVRFIQILFAGLALSLLLLTGFVPVAHAQGCPSGAYRSGVLPAETKVRLVAVSESDAYHPQRAEIVGKLGKVDRMDPTGASGDCWYGGQFYGDDGSSYYFYQAAVQIVSGGVLADSCPPGSSTATLSEGTRVKVLAIHSEDAYHADAAQIIGTQGKVSGDLHSNGGCWMGGGLTADNGTYYYFYKAAVEVISYEAVPVSGASCPPGANTGPLSAGTRVKIVALHPDDAYHADSARIIGTAGAVADDLHANDGCWMGGGFNADDGNYYYFYKAAVTVLGGVATPTPTGERFMGSTITSGQKFRIVALHPDDAYYPDRVNILGKHCHAGDLMNNQDPGWYSGQTYCDDGTDYYFFKVGVVLE